MMSRWLCGLFVVLASFDAPHARAVDQPVEAAARIARRAGSDSIGSPRSRPVAVPGVVERAELSGMNGRTLRIHLRDDRVRRGTLVSINDANLRFKSDIAGGVDAARQILAE